MLMQLEQKAEQEEIGWLVLEPAQALPVLLVAEQMPAWGSLSQRTT